MEGGGHPETNTGWKRGQERGRSGFGDEDGVETRRRTQDGSGDGNGGGDP